MFERITHFLNVNYRLTISFVNVIEITAIFPAVKNTSKLLLYEFRHSHSLLFASALSEFVKSQWRPLHRPAQSKTMACYLS